MSVRVSRSPGGAYRLDAAMTVAAPREAVFAFFADAANLEAITPPWLRFGLRERPSDVHRGTRIDYGMRLHGWPLRWRSEISAWEPPHRFVDEQLRGPYRRWHHEHTFAEAGAGTEVRDRVDFALPPGGRLVAPLVRRDLRRIFGYRQRTLAERFGPRLSSG
jgi:ligand-binding SRPBCC domain-containing protein